MILKLIAPFLLVAAITACGPSEPSNQEAIVPTV